jgi:hypothetical protein
MVTNFRLSSTGHYTSRISLCGKSAALRGRITNSAIVLPVGTAKLTRRQMPEAALNFILDPSDASLRGDLAEDDVWTTGALAYRTKFSSKNPARGYTGRHNFWMEAPLSSDPVATPQGVIAAFNRVRPNGSVRFGMNIAPHKIFFRNSVITWHEENSVPRAFLWQKRFSSGLDDFGRSRVSGTQSALRSDFLYENREGFQQGPLLCRGL